MRTLAIKTILSLSLVMVPFALIAAAYKVAKIRVSTYIRKKPE